MFKAWRIVSIRQGLCLFLHCPSLSLPLINSTAAGVKIDVNVTVTVFPELLYTPKAISSNVIGMTWHMVHVCVFSPVQRSQKQTIKINIWIKIMTYNLVTVTWFSNSEFDRILTFCRSGLEFQTGHIAEIFQLMFLVEVHTRIHLQALTFKKTLSLVIAVAS